MNAKSWTSLLFLLVASIIVSISPVNSADGTSLEHCECSSILHGDAEASGEFIDSVKEYCDQRGGVKLVDHDAKNDFFWGRCADDQFWIHCCADPDIEIENIPEHLLTIPTRLEDTSQRESVGPSPEHNSARHEAIKGPTIITRPGFYYLDEDVASSKCPVVKVEADKVTIDLAGHTLTGECSGPAITARDVSYLTLENGLINGPGSLVSITNAMDVQMRDLNIACNACGSIGPVVSLEGTRFEVLRSRIHSWEDTCILTMLSLEGDNFHLDDVVGFLDLGYPLEFTVRDTTIRNSRFYSVLDYGTVGRADGSHLTNNVFLSEWVTAIEGDHNIIEGNKFSSFLDGAWFYGSRNRIENNEFKRVGFTYHGTESLLAGNYIWDHCFGWGLSITGDYNQYRGNISQRDPGWPCHPPTTCDGFSTAEFCDEGTGNTSLGGNYLPDEM